MQNLEDKARSIREAQHSRTSSRTNRTHNMDEVMTSLEAKNKK